MSKTTDVVRWIDDNTSEALDLLLDFERKAVTAIDGVEVSEKMNWFTFGEEVFVEPSKYDEAIWCTDLANAKKDKEFLTLVAESIAY